MKFQKHTYSCGVFAVINALRAMGTKVTEKRVMAHSGTTPGDGTNEHGIKSALERLGFVGEDIKTESKSEAWNSLTEALAEGSPVILSVDNDQHWVAAVGYCGQHTIVFDSQRTKKNKEENGSPIYGKTQLLHRWGGNEKSFFGIVIKKDE